ncbi:MAG: hypothetical protein AMXMBFR53_38620 [Gemmatimonadota bacterium]
MKQGCPTLEVRAVRRALRRSAKLLWISQRGRDRLAVVRQVVEGLLTLGRAVELVERNRSQVYRIVARFEADGDRAVVDRASGRRPSGIKFEVQQQLSS